MALIEHAAIMPIPFSFLGHWAPLQTFPNSNVSLSVAVIVTPGAPYGGRARPILRVRKRTPGEINSVAVALPVATMTWEES